MSGTIHIKHSLSKEEKYNMLVPQISSLIDGENDLTANLSNICAALKYAMDFFWVGFYLVKPVNKEKKELVLGPFQGPVACTRISFGKGVCGHCWKEKKVVIVDDVNNFPGHIACSSDSKSEIVVPVLDRKNEVFAVLDIDSDKFSAFDHIDEKYLRQLAALISKKLID